MTGSTCLERPAEFAGLFRTDLLARAVYSEAAGIARELPGAVAVPKSVEDLLTLVAHARQTGATLTPRGSGSSMAGGAIGPGIVVDLSRWRGIGDVDVETRRVIVEPGALRNAIDQHARAVGLCFPVDPSSGAFCTIGGMVGTNAAGARSLGYGATRAWVHGLHCVFADGSDAWIRRGEAVPDLPIPRALAAIVEEARPSAVSLRHAGVLKQSSGYGLAEAIDSGDLVDVLVGSEGTLALFASIELSLAPVPTATTTVFGGFPNIDTAADAAIAARAAGAVCCELLEETFLDVARSGGVAVPAGARAALLAEVDDESEGAALASARRLSNAFHRTGATTVEIATTAERVRALWALRHAASPILARLDPALKSMQFIEDGCVPPDAFASYVAGVRMALAEAGVRGVLFGHAGDAHLHVNPLIDVRATDWRDRVRYLLDDVTGLVASLGGTLAGEHGDGRLRAPSLDRVWGARALALFTRCKAVADPDGVFNAGAKIAAPSAPSWTAIKYDPALPELPEEVQGVLREIERERAWHRFRLERLPEPKARKRRLLGFGR